VLFIIKDDYQEWVAYGYVISLVTLTMLAAGSAALVLVKNQQLATLLMVVSFCVITSTMVAVFYKFR
jgi:hypothetical protein